MWQIKIGHSKTNYLGNFGGVRTRTYFLSDVHLGAPSLAESHERERLLVGFLQSIETRCERLFIVGDLFDYWFEYEQVVPKGYVRILGQLALMVDRGMRLEVFTGNHDLWMLDYLEVEVGAVVHRQPLELQLGDQKFYVAHGDGLGPGDRKYKAMKKVLTNPFAIWLYRRFHPNFGVGLAARMSKASRNSHGDDDADFLGEREFQLQHSRNILKDRWVDYFIYGHRHHIQDLVLTTRQVDDRIVTSRYIILGDWITLNSYAVWNGTTLEVAQYTP